jgi:uncharacterized protein (DUF1330 family)
MAAYWMVRSGDIKDEDALKEYQNRFVNIGPRFKAKIIARGQHQKPEEPDFPRVLIVEFPSYQQALACYEDPEYKEAMVYANKALDRQMTSIDGV